MKIRGDRQSCINARAIRAFSLCLTFLIGAQSHAQPSDQSIDYPDDDYTLTAALGVDSNAVFRGQKSTKLNPSVYAVLDFERGPFYTGLQATPSSIQGEIRPFVLLYIGYTPEIGAFDGNIGARYYTFPGSSDFEFDLDDDGVTDHAGKKGFYEFNAGVSRTIKDVNFNVRAFYAPNIFGETGGAFYVNSRVKAPLGSGFELRGDVGVSSFSKDQFNDDYVHYGVGVYKSAFGLDFYLRYTDTSGRAGVNDRIVSVGIEKAWTLAEGGGRAGYLRRKIRNRSWRDDKHSLGVPGYRPK